MQRFKKIVKSDIGKSISSGYVLFLLNNVVALFLTPYILKFVSKEEYGLYILCIDFLAWVSFLDFGINKVMETKAAHLIANEDFENLNQTINTALIIQVFIGILVIPLYYILVYFGLGDTHVKYVNIIIGFFSLSAGLSIIKNLFSSVIVASRKIHLDNRIQIFVNLLQYILVIVLVPFIDILGLAIINMLIFSLMLFRSGFRVKKLFPTFQPSVKSFDKNILNDVLKNGLFFSLSSIATLLLMKVDTFIIGKEFGLEKVASYYISIKLFMLSLKFIELLINNFRPHVSRMFIKKEFEKMKDFYEFSLLTLICFGTIFITLVIFLNEYFVELWVGKSFFLNPYFNMFFGYYILITLFSLPSRIILVSSLHKIYLLAISRTTEGVFRISLILLFLKSDQIEFLPMTSLLSIFLFGILFFHFRIKTFFESNSQQKIKTYLPLFFLVLSTPFWIYYFRLNINFNFLILPFVLTIFVIYFIKKNRVIKNLLATLAKK